MKFCLIVLLVRFMQSNDILFFCCSEHDDSVLLRNRGKNYTKLHGVATRKAVLNIKVV